MPLHVPLFTCQPTHQVDFAIILPGEIVRVVGLLAPYVLDLFTTHAVVPIWENSLPHFTSGWKFVGGRQGHPFTVALLFCHLGCRLCPGNHIFVGCGSRFLGTIWTWRDIREVVVGSESGSRLFPFGMVYKELESLWWFESIILCMAKLKSGMLLLISDEDNGMASHKVCVLFKQSTHSSLLLAHGWCLQKCVDLWGIVIRSWW